MYTSLDILRSESRHLAEVNEFAINALENRVNYVIGQGHRYRIVAKDGKEQESAEKVQELLETFLEGNDWTQRQREMMRRRDRDGEVFVRITPDIKTLAKIRFIDPERVFTPSQKLMHENTSFGILTSAADVEEVTGYWVDEKFYAVTEIHHRKSNVDSTVKRGVPLLTPVRKNLYRAEKLLRNMSVVSNIQSSIALIRRHQTANREAVRQFVRDQASKTLYNENGEVLQTFQQFAPGTIIDSGTNTEYEFPAAAVNAGAFISVLQAELRAIASRLVMPEFMLTSDASNANYSSTMVAEGPAVRMFERLQHEIIGEDLRLLRKVFDRAAEFGIIEKNLLQKVIIHVIPPMLAARDRLEEAQADKILYELGIMSKETFAMRYGLAPEQESRLTCRCETQQ